MWSLPWRSMEATWASSREQCSSLSPSPGWTRWLWVTPTPCVSGRNRNHHAKARNWAKAPAQLKRLKPLYLPAPPLGFPSLQTRPHTGDAGNNPKLAFSFSAFYSDAREHPSSSPSHTGTEDGGRPCPPLFWERLLASPRLSGHIWS